MEISIITPIYVGNDHERERRERLFKRTLESIKNQDFTGEFEHIIVNDGSTLPLSIPDTSYTSVVEQKNSGRIEAFNTGLKASKGKIICFLDSDDEYTPSYLSRVSFFFKHYPNYKLFNFGCEMVHSDGATTLRDEFRPKRKKVGHEIFQGGNIVNGAFVFHRSIYEDLGAFPPLEVKQVDTTVLNYPAWAGQPEPYIRDLITSSPYDFSAIAQLEFPELQKYYMVKHPDHPKHLVREFGNPFGNDYYLFYKYTRKYHSKPIHEYLLRVNLKA